MGNTGYLGTSLDASYDSMRSYRDPIQEMSVPVDNKSYYKATFTKAFWNNPVFGRPRDIDYNYLEPYEMNVWIRMVIGHICDSVVRTGYNIVPIDKTSDNIPENHIKELNEFFSSKTWSESWQITMRRMIPDLLLYDAGIIVKLFPKNAYNEKGELKNKNAKPVGIISRDGRSFLVDSDLYGNVKKYFQYSWISPQARPISFSKDEVMYMQMRPQSRSPYGISSLDIVRDILDYLTASVTTQRKYFENNFPIGGVIDHPDMVDEDELRLRSQLYQETLRGENQSGKWLMTMGGTKVTPLTTSAKDNQWIESSQFFGKLVFALFKVSPSELGFTEDLNRATATQQSQNYKQKGVRNILALIEEYINREIVWKHFYTDVEFRFDDSLDLMDKKIRADIDHTKLGDGTLTVNEVRKRDGKDVYDVEYFNKPYAAQAAQEALMQGMGEGEEEEEEYTPPGEDYDWTEETTRELAQKMEKAVNVGAGSGSPGFAFTPRVHDGQKQKKADEKLENETVEDLDEWKKDQQVSILENLKVIYQ